METCRRCGKTMPQDQRHCPICDHDNGWPHIRRAEQERDHLVERHRAALDEADKRGVLSVVELFSQSAEGSKAVKCVEVADLVQVVFRRNATTQSYYGKSTQRGLLYETVNAAVAHEDRVLADLFLLPGIDAKISFAALSTDGGGATGFGAANLTLRDDCMRPRAAVLEQNGVLFVKHHKIGSIKDVPQGYRATWGDRGLLCVAKLAKRIGPSLAPDSFSALLLEPTPARSGDLVEVQIWGEIGLEELEEVVIHRVPEMEARLVDACLERLRDHGVPVYDKRVK